MIILDGRHGEGGGQILRTALAFSMITQKPFRMEHIRAGRPKPGLKAQHLWGIKALQMLSASRANGAELGAEQIEFHPAPLQLRNIQVDVQTAGSLTLLLQALLPPLVFLGKERPVVLELIGGTDVKWAPPIDYYSETFLPAIRPLADVRVEILKRGYYPKGGGKVIVTVGNEHDPLPSLDLTCADPYLGDQLIPYLAIGGGCISVPEITPHIKSNIYAVESFLDKGFTIENKKICFSRS